MTNLNIESKWINPFESIEKYVIHLACVLLTKDKSKDSHF